MSSEPLYPQLAITYYTYVLIFFVSLAAASAAKLLAGRGRGKEAIR